MVNSERYLGAMWEPRLLLMDPARLVREEKRHAITLGAGVIPARRSPGGPHLRGAALGAGHIGPAVPRPADHSRTRPPTTAQYGQNLAAATLP
jgi:hypothetical protein